MVRFKAKKKEKKEKEWVPEPGRHKHQPTFYQCGLIEKHGNQRDRKARKRTIDDVNQALQAR